MVASIYKKNVSIFRACGRNYSDCHIDSSQDLPRVRNEFAGSRIDIIRKLPYHGEVNFMCDIIDGIPANAASLLRNRYIQHPRLSLQPDSCKCRSNADQRYR